MDVRELVPRKPSSLGMVSGAIAGMVAITPAAGFVTTACCAAYRGGCRRSLFLHDARPDPQAAG